MESRKRVGSCLGILTALIVCLFAPSLVGQAVNGTLLGTITDTSGATVAGAKVLATSGPDWCRPRVALERKRQLLFS